MAVLYRLSQNKMEGSKAYGKWYAQAVMTGVVDTNALATIMQRNCTVKKADILAVITELIETMQDQLQDSKRVKLDGFGSFKIGIENEKGGALTAAEFSLRTWSIPRSRRTTRTVARKAVLAVALRLATTRRVAAALTLAATTRAAARPSQVRATDPSR